MNHCKHCNHDKVNHGSRNGCSVCKRVCIEAHDNFWDNNPELADMQFDKKGLTKNKELKLWQHWVKNQHFSDSKLFDAMTKHYLLQYQLDNISPCMEFDQWWYGHGIYESGYDQNELCAICNQREWDHPVDLKKVKCKEFATSEKTFPDKRITVDLRQVKIGDVQEIITNEIEEMEREFNVQTKNRIAFEKNKAKLSVKTPLKQTKKGRKK